MHGSRLKQQHVASAHSCFHQVRMIGKVIGLAWAQMGEFGFVLVRAFKEVNAAVFAIGIVQCDPDHATVNCVDMRINLFIVFVLGEEACGCRNGLCTE